jgi:hypothetical protein
MKDGASQKHDCERLWLSRMLANSFLKTDALTCFQTIYTVITAVHMHENVGAAGIPFDESEAPIISVIFHDASRHFRLRSPDTNSGL